jgi:phosphoribosylanthranilate isomerase
MWIKICGLTDEAGVAAARDAKADAIGFVFFPPSPRHIAFARAAALAESVRGPSRGKAEIVALTVNAEDAFLDELVATVRPDVLQLHGSETPERVAALKARFDLPVMKALLIAEKSDLDAIAAYCDVADRILFDAKPPKDATRPGGNGEAFDWTLLGHVDKSIDYVLSGGLNADNVADALAIAKKAGRMPWGVDVSSGVEDAPGLKNAGRVAQFAKAVRALLEDEPGQIAAAKTA